MGGPSHLVANDEAPSVHIGVRQASEGGQVPVTVVGADPGSTWVVEIGDAELGTLSVGPDGTGTALVMVPAGASAGVAELTATGPGGELTAAVSVAGPPGHAAPSAAGAAGGTADPLPFALGGGLVVLAAVAVAVLVARRRRRRSASAS